MKKKVLLAALIVICVAIAASGTLAYFTAEDQAHNVITSSGVDIKIEEWQKTDNGLLPYPEGPIAFMPGVSVSKIVDINNLQAESYVRAKFELIIRDAEGTEMDLSEEEAALLIKIAVNEPDWVRKEGDTEWWYCSAALGTGDVSAPFITEVAFDGPNMTNEYQGCTVDVIVSAQAVQTANNGGSAVNAVGWPA